jgi:hypothetical protein
MTTTSKSPAISGTYSSDSSASYEDLAVVEKRNEIEKLLGEADVDLWKLREMCLSEGGLLNGKLMLQRVCSVYEYYFVFMCLITCERFAGCQL